jgi:ATP-binding cassette subfamily B protein/subfamily B ATP-binding cassette protein MsbA
MLLSVLVGLAVPWPMRYLIDSVLGGQPLPAFLAAILPSQTEGRSALLIVLVAATVLFAVLLSALTVLSNYLSTKAELSMVLDTRSDLFQHLQQLQLAWHEQQRFGLLMYLNLLAESPAHLLMTMPALAQSLLTLLGMFIVLLVLDVKLALLALLIVPFLYYSVGYYARHIEPRIWRTRQLEGESMSILHEALQLLRVILAFGRQPHEYRRFREQGAQAVNARVKVTVLQTLFSLVVTTITAVGTAVVVGVAAYQVLQDLDKPPEQQRMTVGTLWVIVTYLAMVYEPLKTISTTMAALQESIVNTKTCFGILDTKPQIKDSPGAVPLRDAIGHLAFQDVHFSHEGREGTLKNVSFEVKPGEVIAIVGPTGAGKTTLISLLLRFYDYQGGKILLDGTDIKRFTLRSLREQISLVLQEPLLFSGTIADNIRYGRLDASMTDVMAAATAANAHDFIMALPEKYNTVLGERGLQLSGGERQRVSVARAFLKNAPILVLDEPTSSIDSRTESVFLDALDRLMAGRTTFLIAHRLSTIRGADRIFVMDKGELVETGTHEELLAQGGLYRELYDLQVKVADAVVLTGPSSGPLQERPVTTYLELICPGCRRPVKTRAEYLGKRVVCKTCHDTFRAHLELICPGCRRPVKTRAQCLGKRVVCKTCHHTFRAEVPTGPEEPTPSEYLEFLCPGCRRPVKTRAEHLGKWVVCKACNHTFRAEAPTGPEKPTPCDEAVGATGRQERRPDVGPWDEGETEGPG